MIIVKSLKKFPSPQVLIFLILATLPLERIPSIDIFGATIRISQILGLILITYSLPFIWRSRKNFFRPPWVFIIAFLSISLVSALLSAHPSESTKITAFISFVVALAYVISLHFKMKYLKYYFISVLVGVLFSAVFGIYQFFGDLANLPGWVTGLGHNYMKGGIFPFPRVQSTSLEPLYYANYLLVPLALISFALLIHRRNIWPLLTLVLTALVLTLSRGAQAAAAVILIVSSIYGFATSRTKRTSIQLASILLAIFFSFSFIGLGSILYPQYGPNKTTIQSNVDDFAKQATNINAGESAEGRAITRGLALEAAAEKPLLGIGPGNFGFYANEVMPDKFVNSDAIVNNETLEIASEHGFVGLALMAAFIMSIGMKANWTIRSGITDEKNKIMIFGLLVGLIAIGLQYQLFSTLYITHIWVALGFLIGAIYNQDKDLKNENSN